MSKWMIGKLMLKKGALAAVLFLSTASFAVAADSTMAVMDHSDQFDWTGWYVTGQAGFGSGSSTLVATAATPNPDLPLAFSPSGALGGLAAGYNMQNGNFVFGVELGWLGGKINDSKTGASATAYTVNLDNIFTVGPRIGVAMDDVLLYAEAGFATATVSGEGVKLGTAVAITGDRAIGYYVGAGVDFALDSNWVLGAEYNYINLGDKTYGVVQTLPAPATGTMNVNDVSVNTLTLKLSYKFD